MEKAILENKVELIRIAIHMLKIMENQEQNVAQGEEEHQIMT